VDNVLKMPSSEARGEVSAGGVASGLRWGCWRTENETGGEGARLCVPGQRTASCSKRLPARPQGKGTGGVPAAVRW